MPAVLAALSVHGIVEIAGIRSSDRHQGQITQITPALAHGLSYRVSKSPGFGFYAIGPFKRQVKVANRNFRRHPGRTTFAQNFDNAAHRWLALAGLLQDFRHHDLAGTRPVGVLQWNHYVLVDAGIIRHHQGDTALLYKTAHDSFMRPFQYFAHSAFAPPPGIHPDDRSQYAVAVQHAAHLPG